MPTDRIEALERQVAEFADHVVALAQTTVAQGIVCRVAVDLLGRAGVSMDEVRDIACGAAEGMSGEVATAVRVLLAEPPAGAGRVQ